MLLFMMMGSKTCQMSTFPYFSLQSFSISLRLAYEITIYSPARISLTLATSDQVRLERTGIKQPERNEAFGTWIDIRTLQLLIKRSESSMYFEVHPSKFIAARGPNASYPSPL